MRRLSTPIVEPLARVFVSTLRRASSADVADSNIVEAEDSSRADGSTPSDEVATTAPPIQELSAPARSVASSDADLPPRIQDMLYSYQLTLSKPLLLSPLAFHTANIVWRYKDSQRVYKTLQKKGIITAAGEIKTRAITKSFAHQFAYLSAFAQRRIIGVLFWWEEEIQRLKGLYEQEKEIKRLLESMPQDNDGPESTVALLRTELTRVRILVNLKPSERVEIEEEGQEQLPAYSVSPLASPNELIDDPLAQ